MAEHKDYGLTGVNHVVQLGKQGPHLKSTGDGTFSVVDSSGSTLTKMAGSNATSSTHFVTKAQMDTVVSDSSADSLQLGASVDASWTDGAVQSLTNSTTVTEAIDKLNESMENVRNDTFVKSVDATSDVSSGGDPLTVTLTTTVVGNANRYTIAWGDGSANTTATSDSTPSHTYTDNSNSPYDVVVTAFNNNGSGEGSTASVTKTDFITLYTATPVADFDLYAALAGGSALTGDNREIDSGETIYLENVTTNSSSATCTYDINWGDGSSTVNVASNAAGDVGQARISHTYSSDSGSSRFTITLEQTAHSTADPGEVGSTTTDTLKVYDPSIAAPSGLSTKTLSFGESNTGSSPYLAHGFTENSEVAMTAGAPVTRITSSSAGSDTNSDTLTSFSYNASAGNLHAVVDGNISGTIALTGANDAGTNANLEITQESDYQALTSAGTSTSFASSTFSPSLYSGFKARVSATSTDLITGSHSFKLSHDVTGNTNVVVFVKDDVTSRGVVDFSSATLAQSSAGTLAYESGVPYYTDDAVLTLTGVQLYNWIGQTYKSDSTPFDIANGTNSEGTSGSVITTTGHSYATIDGSSTYLNGSTPIADTGKDSSNKYTIGTITVNVGAGGTGIEQLKARINNVNGNGSYAEHTAVKVQALNSNSGVYETIPVADSLGATFDDDGLRITGFPSSDNPSFSSSTNYYTGSVWSGVETIAGTQEAVTRFGTLSHFTTDLSSGILPAGPDLNTGRSGAQYFTFAFRRTTMANFAITLSGKVSGIFIAAPATDIDSASTLNGWLDAGLTYGGAGTPGANTGSGGNGSNGCAFTSGDRVIDGTTYSNDSFTFTLGDQNATNSFGNNILVRIKLEDGDSITALSIA